MKKLAVAWEYDPDEAGIDIGIETNLVVVGCVMYAYTASLGMVAVDATNGKQIWEFASGVTGAQPSRGVACWTNGKQRLLPCGIMNYLYELDATTGRPVASFVENVRFDLRRGLHGDYRQQSIEFTSPGVIY